MTLSIQNVTESQIETLLRAAKQVGDGDVIAVATRALDGDDAAREEAVDQILNGYCDEVLGTH